MPVFIIIIYPLFLMELKASLDIYIVYGVLAGQFSVSCNNDHNWGKTGSLQHGGDPGNVGFSL